MKKANQNIKAIVNIFCPWWGRPSITKLHADSILKLMAAAPEKVLCRYLVVLSPEDEHYTELKKIAVSHGFMTINAPNDPVGRKMNHGIAWLMGEGEYGPKDPVWLMNIGSDDLVDPSYWELCAPYLLKGSGHIYGIDKLCICDEALTTSFNLTLNTIGALRFVRLYAIQRLKEDWQLPMYPPLANRVLDGGSAANLKLIGAEWHIMLSEKTFICDVKGDTNITPINKFLKLAGNEGFRMVDIECAKAFFPDYHKPEPDAERFAKGIPKNKPIFAGLKVFVFDNGQKVDGQVVKVNFAQKLVTLKAYGGKRFKNKVFSFSELHLP